MSVSTLGNCYSSIPPLLSFNVENITDFSLTSNIISHFNYCQKSMDVFSLVFVLIIFITVSLILALGSLGSPSRVTRKHLPPGPVPLPIIGNLLQLGDKPHRSLAELAKIHGPIMSLKLGQITSIVVSSPDMARQVLHTHDLLLSNRSIPDAVAACTHDEFSLAFMPVSPRWRNLRKICATELFSNKILDANQNLRRAKLQELLADVHRSSSTGKAVDIGKLAFKATINLLSNTIFSVDLLASNSDDVAVAGEYKETVWNIMKEVGTPNLSDYFPVFKSYDAQGVRSRTAVHFRKMLDLFDNFINQRLEWKSEDKTGSNSNINKDDMLEILLNISKQNMDEMDNTRISHLLLDLFGAGTDTTTSTAEWAMAELLHDPRVLSKAKVELERTIGRGKPIEESDIPKLPYLQAIIKETFRLHPPVPLLLPRKAETDVEIGGYTVPKGAQVLVNVWAIGRDPSTWDSNSNMFMPERFLGVDIDYKGRNFELTPFGAGRRICPGLNLATRMVHLILGSLINCFDWILEDGLKPQQVCLEDKFGLTLQIAKPVCAVPVPIKE
uniref:Cytochrome P450 oxidase CYP76F94 n=1 Tax=Polygala tenuifolia TaxID=355332 RepID=A0A3G5AR77_9FABA|nr:cytochrome P450 oxidase CYP76F94 [Polygala tenuifolia]